MAAEIAREGCPADTDGGRPLKNRGHRVSAVHATTHVGTGRFGDRPPVRWRVYDLLTAIRTVHGGRV
jgi:hypothetical protein